MQVFGYCKEFENHNRKTPWGATVNDLIWNQRDAKGNLVGSGVYIWKVALSFENGKSYNISKKQGIARSTEPSLTCAVDNQ
jgi:hypothetical protein